MTVDKNHPRNTGKECTQLFHNKNRAHTDNNMIAYNTENMMPLLCVTIYVINIKIISLKQINISKQK